MDLIRTFILMTCLLSTVKDSNGGLLHALGIINELIDLVINIIDLSELMSEECNVLVIGKFEDVMNKMDIIESKVDENSYYLKNIDQVIKNELRLSNLRLILSEIQRKSKLLKVYRDINKNRNRTGYEQPGLRDLTSSIISHDYHSILSLWDRLHNSYMIPGMDSSAAIRHDSILHEMANYLKNKMNQHHICKSKQSPRQSLFTLYKSLQLHQLKAFTLMEFSWFYLRNTNASLDYHDEMLAMKEQYLLRLPEQLKEARNEMSRVTNDYWMCGPTWKEEGLTYVRLTYFLQGFIVNEVDINSGSHCWKNCAYYQNAKQSGCYVNYCAKQPVCRGSVRDCEFIESHMEICPADYKGDKRRYDWIKYNSGRTYGSKGNCRKNVDYVNSWWRWLFWHCSYCFCICDEEYNQISDRYFSLTSSLSDVEKNRVVTGVRFIKKNQVIYLQGQEGELLPKGQINSLSLRWIPLDEVYPLSIYYHDGNHYFEMSYNKRNFYLGDVHAQDGYIITGVKLFQSYSNLRFKVKFCKWNFTTGKLQHRNSNDCYWLEEKTSYIREVYLNKKRIPTDWESPTTIYSNDGYVRFTYTSRDEDASQTAIPYIDAQPVIPIPPVPLVGVGIYLKGADVSGGYIAPKVYPLEHLRYINGHS